MLLLNKRTRNKLAPGFSLIQVLVSSAMVMVLLQLTMTHVSFLDQLLVKTELNLLYATCCYAQQIAQWRQQPCEITCNQTKNTYQCQHYIRELPASVKFGVKQGVYGPPSDPRSIVTNPITFKDGCIRASVTGMLNAGTLYLIGGGRYQYALSCAVTQAPYVRCYRYDKAFHLLE